MGWAGHGLRDQRHSRRRWPAVPVGDAVGLRDRPLRPRAAVQLRLPALGARHCSHRHGHPGPGAVRQRDCRWTLSCAGTSGAKRQDRDGQYRWPIQLVRLVFVTVFLAAGLAKLRQAGLEWVLSDTLRNYFLENQYVFRLEGARGWSHLLADWLIARPGLVQGMLAIGVLVVELSAPATLFSRRRAAGANSLAVPVPGRKCSIALSGLPFRLPGVVFLLGIMGKGQGRTGKIWVRPATDWRPLLLVLWHRRFQLGNQTRDVFLHGLPDALQVDVEIPMHKTIPHADNFGPGDSACAP